MNIKCITLFVFALTFGVSTRDATASDVIFTYDVDGAYSATILHPAGLLSGTLTVDQTTNSVTGVNIQASGISSNFTVLGGVNSVGANLLLDLANTSSSSDGFALTLETEATLFNGETTIISPLSFLSGGDIGGGVAQASGSLTLAAAVPEPSTWAMMFLGFAGISFMAYRRSQFRAA